VVDHQLEHTAERSASLARGSAVARPEGAAAGLGAAGRAVPPDAGLAGAVDPARTVVLRGFSVDFCDAAMVLLTVRCTNDAS
jgi:hypothetical protein